MSTQTECHEAERNSPAAENARLLDHFSAEIGRVLCDLGQDFDELTQVVIAALPGFDAAGEEAGPKILTLLQVCDRFSQRLQNIERGLSSYAKTVRTTTPPLQDASWMELLRELRSLYTTAEERTSFDKMFPEVEGGTDLRTANGDAGAVMLFDEVADDA